MLLAIQIGLVGSTFCFLVQSLILDAGVCTGSNGISLLKACGLLDSDPDNPSPPSIFWALWRGGLEWGRHWGGGAELRNNNNRIIVGKVPRVLEPLKSSCGHFSHPAGHGRFKPKNTQNGQKMDLPGLAFSANACESYKSSDPDNHPMVKSAGVLEPLKSSYGHFSHPAGHGRFKPKNTQNGNKSRFPGATCIFSKCCEIQKRRARNSASNGQKYRAFWSP